MMENLVAPPLLPEQEWALEDFRRVVERPGPSLVTLTGTTEEGIPGVVAAGLEGIPTVHLACSELPDLDHRESLDGALEDEFGPGPPIEPRTPFEAGPGPTPDWRNLLAGIPARDATPTGPRALVLTGVERLGVGSPRVLGEIAAGWDSLRRSSHRVVVVLCFGPGGIPADMAALDGGLLGSASRSTDEMPLTVRGVAEVLAAWGPEDRLLAWALFGGAPGRISLLDPERSLRRNIEELLFDPNGPLHRDMDSFLRRPTLTQPGRYATALALISRGARGWKEIRKGFEERGQGRPGPYVAKLRELGILRAESSLDAAGGQRSTRYYVEDPLVKAWFSWLLPVRPLLLSGRGRDVWKTVLKPTLRDALPGMIPRAVLDLLAHRGVDSIGPRARVSGGLWGPGYDIPVAGVLGNGAVCYGTTSPDWSNASATQLDELVAQIRETRYGFGREVRLKIVASLSGHDAALDRIAARDESVRLLGLRDLVGE